MKRLITSILFCSLLLAPRATVTAQDTNTKNNENNTTKEGDNKDSQKCKKNPLGDKCDSKEKK